MNSIFKNWKKGSVLLTDAGWGDSGKGKCVSALKVDIGAKIIGGHNAGHTIVSDKGEFGLGLIPSTIIYPKTLNLIGPEVVINPFFLMDEINKLNSRGVKITPKNLVFDEKSHMVMPWHEIRDALSEEVRGKAAIGSLHLGVGWTYSDRINRRGLRFIDLFANDWKQKIKKELEMQKWIIEDMAEEVKRKTGKKSVVQRKIGKADLLQKLTEARIALSPYKGNTIGIIWRAIDKNKKIIFEDSHGAMLDISHGSWPFTTGVNTGLGALYRSFGGKAVRSIKKIVVVMKAYQTRVGGGPMPTEDFGKLGDYLCTKGGEIGTRSGRKRRCGAIDIPLLLHGLNTVGLTQNDEIALTKLDILTGLKKIPVCTAYKYKDKVYKITPRVDAEFLINVKPIFTNLRGWHENITGVRKFKSLPVNAQKYVLFLQAKLCRNITLIGVGKHKDAIIVT